MYFMFFFFFKQKTAYEMRISDWSSDVCSSDLFKGKTIGVQISTTHENFLREYMANDVTIKSYDTQENLDLDLQSGRVDAALASASYWVPLLASDKGKEMVMVGPQVTSRPFGAVVGAGIRRGDTDRKGVEWGTGGQDV